MPDLNNEILLKEFVVLRGLIDATVVFSG